MKLKSLLFVLGLASAATANANTYVLGDVTGVIAPPAIYNHDSGLFSDFFFFNLSASSIASGTLADLPIGSFDGGSYYNIDGSTFTFSVFEDQGSVGIADAADIETVLGVGNYVHTHGPLDTGNYYLKIAGNAIGDHGGSYMLQATALPVPEADTYAMMLAGLGLMGGIARRRKQK